MKNTNKIFNLSQATNTKGIRFIVIKLTQTLKFKGNICGKPQVNSCPVGCRPYQSALRGNSRQIRLVQESIMFAHETLPLIYLFCKSK